MAFKHTLLWLTAQEDIKQQDLRFFTVVKIKTVVLWIQKL